MAGQPESPNAGEVSPASTIKAEPGTPESVGTIKLHCAEENQPQSPKSVPDHESGGRQEKIPCGKKKSPKRGRTGRLRKKAKQDPNYTRYPELAPILISEEDYDEMWSYYAPTQGPGTMNSMRQPELLSSFIDQSGQFQAHNADYDENFHHGQPGQHPFTQEFTGGYESPQIPYNQPTFGVGSQNQVPYFNPDQRRSQNRVAYQRRPYRAVGRRGNRYHCAYQFRINPSIEVDEVEYLTSEVGQGEQQDYATKIPEHESYDNMPALVRHGEPDFTILKNNLYQAGEDGSRDPFLDVTLMWKPVKYGVVKIGNIPYSVTKKEILHFLGKGANLIRDQWMGCSVHIIMERSTGKTMDCYLEYRSQQDADRHFERQFGTYGPAGPTTHPKISARHVFVEKSSQDQLLQDLFPRTKCIVWEDGKPIRVPNEDRFSLGFRGFMTEEELYCLKHHAEAPARSPFSMKCMQRAYECTISTLYKFPWHARDLYTVKQRDQLFDVFIKQLDRLCYKVYNDRIVSLNRTLLQDFLCAGFNCVGFSERQKFQIEDTAKAVEFQGKMSELAQVWPFTVLSRKQHVIDEDTEIYMKCVEVGWRTIAKMANQPILCRDYVVKGKKLNYQRESKWDIEYDIFFTINEGGGEKTWDEAEKYERALCKFLLHVGAATMAQEMGLDFTYPFTDQESLVNAMHALCADCNHKEVPQMIEAGPSSEEISPLTVPQHNSQFPPSTPRQAQADNANADTTPHFATSRQTPLGHVVGSSSAPHTRSNSVISPLQTTGFGTPLPQQRQSINGNEQAPHHRRMSSSDLAWLAKATAMPISSPSSRNGGNAIRGNGIPRMGLSHSTSMISNRSRLSIDETIREESDDDLDGLGAGLFIKPDKRSYRVPITKPGSPIKPGNDQGGVRVNGKAPEKPKIQTSYRDALTKGTEDFGSENGKQARVDSLESSDS